MRTITLYFLILVSLNALSQEKEKRERIKALKVAYITEQLSLTKSEAEGFWPVYNAFEEQEQQIRKDNYSKRKETDIESLSEQEAKQMIDEMLVIESKKHAIREKFIKDLLKILPSKKIIKLKLAEDQFNKKMFEEFKKRRDFKKDRP